MPRSRRITIVIAALACAATLATPARALGPAPNSGEFGSTCEATAGKLRYTAPDPSLSTTSLGADAPAYYEVGQPSGSFAGTRPKAVMLMIHGGGWFTVGPPAVAASRPVAETWRARGWMTVSVSYRACDKSIGDVVWFMQRVRQLQPTTPICASGASAGGHLALLLGSIRHDLACVIATGAPTDLAALPLQQSWNYDTNRYDGVGSSKLYNWAAAAFGTTNVSLGMDSPSRYVRNVRARVLIATGEHDMFVPPAQTRKYASTLRAARPANYVDALVLEPGMVPFVHTGISKAARDKFNARVDALVAPVVAGR